MYVSISCPLVLVSTKSGTMAKRIPVDCKRLTETHLRNLSHDELVGIFERIETQTQALARAGRLVMRAVDHLDD